MATAKQPAVSVSKVVIKIGDDERALTLDQAKELHQALGELFRETLIREEHHHHDYHHWTPRWDFHFDTQPIPVRPYHGGYYGTTTFGDSTNDPQPTGVYTLSFSDPIN